MALSIMTNTASLSAQRNLTRTQMSLTRNIGRLSSGLRINNASDDAAGLAIASRMSAQIRSITQASRNANDAVSMLQTAEGALNASNGMLARMRELAVQASNGGTLGTAERSALNDEYQALALEITRISDVTEYNGANLLDGTLGTVAFQVGIFDSANDRISTTAFVNMDAATLGIAGDLTTATNAQLEITAVDSAIDTVSDTRGDFGALQNRVEVTISNLANLHENLSAAHSRIMDVDVAEETASFTRNQILMQAGVSVLAQANQMPSVALSLLG